MTSIDSKKKYLDRFSSLSEENLYAILDDLGLSYSTSGKNVGAGWIGIEICPWCNAGNYHFGLNIEGKYFSCWVCKNAGTLLRLIMKVRRCSFIEAEHFLSEYTEAHEEKEFLDEIMEEFINKKEEVIEEKKEENKITLPGIPFPTKYTRPNRYLKMRKISTKMCRKFNLRYDHKSMRIIIPIYTKDGTLYGYQARTVTRAPIKYLFYPRGRSTGKVLYNLDKYNGEPYLIVTEGAIDAIRVYDMLHKIIPEKADKFHPVACFTNKVTFEQLTLIPSRVYKIISMLDSDSWFHTSFVASLFIDYETLILPVGKDPASLTDREFLNLLSDIM